jgi:hypothetical protein
MAEGVFLAATAGLTRASVPLSSQVCRRRKKEPSITVFRNRKPRSDSQL